MRIIVVGGGKVGSFLARELEEGGHVVAVVEPHSDRARQLTDETDAIVFEGDGTDISILKAADVHRADWLLAVTGLDEVNLVACELALTLGAHRVLARLNNPLNRPTFDALAIPVVAVTDLMAEVMFREVEIPDMSRIALLGDGDLSISEIEIPPGFPVTTVGALELPGPSVLVAVERQGRAFVPQADTRLAPGDRVIAVTSVANEAALQETFTIEVEA